MKDAKNGNPTFTPASGFAIQIAPSSFFIKSYHALPPNPAEKSNNTMTIVTTRKRKWPARFMKFFPVANCAGQRARAIPALTDLTTMAMASLTVENQVVGRKTILEPKTAAI
ncbi:MAG TPA: hypothetical protein VF435_19280, partial [Pyrinomonadaceae bacterium]